MEHYEAVLKNIADGVIELKQHIVRLQTEMGHVATKEDVFRSIDSHVYREHRQSLPPYNKKQFGALIGAITVIATALATIAQTIMQ